MLSQGDILNTRKTAGVAPPTLNRTTAYAVFRSIGLLAVAIGTVVTSAAAIAQSTFPAKPVRIVIGFPPGGGIDIVGRLLAPELSKRFGQPVIVENRAGAAGNIALEHVAKSPADGTTVLLGTTGNLSVNPVFYPNLPFDIGRDFAPISKLVDVAFLLFTNPQLPIRSIAELIAYAKAQPAKINYSSSGSGGLPHLGAEMLSRQAGMGALHVPYKGSAPAIADLIGGQVQFTIDAVAIGLPHVQSGKLRALATTSPQRLSILPDVPAVAETVSGFETVNWYGMVAPAGTSAEAISRWHAEIVRAMGLPEIREKLIALGTEPVGSTPTAFGALMKRESEKWGRVVREANIRPD